MAAAKIKVTRAPDPPAKKAPEKEPKADEPTPPRGTHTILDLDRDTVVEAHAEDGRWLVDLVQAADAEHGERRVTLVGSHEQLNPLVDGIDRARASGYRW